MITCGITLSVIGICRTNLTRADLIFASVIFWLQLPVITFFMYLANGGSDLWLATLTAMMLVYFVLTDWRIAAVGTIVGFFVAYVFHRIMILPIYYSFERDWRIDAAVLIFVWGAGLVIGTSAASRQKLQLKHMLATVGIIAHELRTPLTAISLMTEATDNFTQLSNDPALRKKLQDLSNRTRLLTTQMNALIDMQIANASLENLPKIKEVLVASDLIKKTMLRYPFKTPKERNCWKLEIKQDFCFNGQHLLFQQVIFNMTKNAINALHKAESDFFHGSIIIRLLTHEKWGIIEIQDDGTGIDPKLHKSIFEAFFSTNTNMGHGLGLTFSKRVINSVNGSITVQSNGYSGTKFIIKLPKIIS